MAVLRDIFLVFRIAMRELRGSWRSFSILFLCLYLGVAMMASVQSLARNINLAIKHDGRYILGGDIAIRTIGSPITDDKIAFLRHLGVVSVVMETRAIARREDGKKSSLVEVKAVDPFYPPYGIVNFVDEKGKTIMFPDDKGNIREATAQDMVLPTSMEDFEAGRSLWGVAVEKELLKRLNLHIGDVLKLGKQRFRIRGIINHEPDKLGSSKLTVFPRVLMSYYTIEDTGLAQEGNRIFYDHRIIMPYIKKIADLQEAIKKITDKYPNENWQGRTFLDAAPNMRKNIESFNLFLTLMSLSALLIGGIGIAGAIRAYLQKKYLIIASLKSLGADAKKIFWIYFVQVILIAMPAVVMAIITAIVINYTAMPLITDKLSLNNFVKIYPDIIISSALFGFVILFMFMILPISNACRVKIAALFRSSVEEIESKLTFKNTLAVFIMAELFFLSLFLVIEDYLLLLLFFAVGFLLSIFFIILAFLFKKIARHIRPQMYPALRLAFANIYRPGNSTNSIFISMGVVLTIIISIFALEDSFKLSVSQDFAKAAPDFYIMDIKPPVIKELKTEIEQKTKIKELKFIPILKAKLKDTKTRFDISYMEENLLNLPIQAGKWWQDKKNKQKLFVSIDEEFAKINKLKLADKIELIVAGKNIKAEILNIRKTIQNSFSINFPIILSSNPSPENKDITYMASLKISGNNEIKIQNYLANKFPDLLIIRTKEAFGAIIKLTSSVANYIKTGVMITIIIAILVLEGAIMSGQQRRVYDISVLKLLGVRRKDITKIFLLEYGMVSMFIGIFAACLGIGIAGGISTYVLNIDYIIANNITLSMLIVLSCIIITLSVGYLNIIGLISQKSSILLHKILS